MAHSRRKGAGREGSLAGVTGRFATMIAGSTSVRQIWRGTHVAMQENAQALYRGDRGNWHQFRAMIVAGDFYNSPVGVGITVVAIVLILLFGVFRRLRGRRG